MATAILDHVYTHEAERPDHVFLTQPVGGGAVVDTTWGQLMDQSRRMAAHLLGLGPDAAWRVLSYLPLAHAYERASVACAMLMDGDGRLYFTESLATFRPTCGARGPPCSCRCRGCG